MDLSPTEKEQAFREEVRGWLAANLPADIADKVKRGLMVAKPDMLRWHAILREKGWLAPNWPKAAGGAGFSIMERHIFDMECRLAHAPPAMAFNFHMIGPALIAFGTDAQKAHYLPKILSDAHWWCQGYSEPGAGSDLAGVSTRAVRDGDEYVVTGSKIWTSAADVADMIFCLVRTDPDAKKQEGISFLLMDMTAPGVEVKPLIALNGRRLWNIVTFDEVRVPAANLLGRENEGWTVAKKLLGDERLFVSRVSENTRILSIVKEVCAAESSEGRPLLEDPDFALTIADLESRLKALEMTSLRILAEADAGGRVGAEPSMTKLLGSHMVQDLDEVLYRAIGYYGAPDHSGFLFRGENQLPVGPDYAVGITSGQLHHRGFTIAGGTSEVQRGVLAKAVLGL
ncbi:acyl-CoA dehydrogenase family protein [Minwuia thermotolerans]|uniref:Pimeloyl-CoA dehydrogenase large subunit n=1 Tax=Minwuia thermotolerans TaxID=2056226 RepID=A0A2M9G0Y1_9PROT|nr:acyl-CoA dehydrogenase family protein [Minwuia thermotolerans]PJK29363.1 pimeloyl-CoA dehydrogenase large subunit [Minwuia thermotolerans]